ncbi:transcriptional regulator, partial [Virgibacillus sp. 7505]
MEFYRKLKKLRAQKGWSQEEFAEKLQVSRQ